MNQENFNVAVAVDAVFGRVKPFTEEQFYVATVVTVAAVAMGVN